MKQCGFCHLQSDTKSRCSKCKVTYYCSRECQTKHWSKHKTECSTQLELREIVPSIKLFSQMDIRRELIPDPELLEIKNTESKGRGVFAKKLIKRGTKIFEEAPFICCTQHVVEMRYERHCGNCFTPAPFIDTVHRCTNPPVRCRNHCSYVFCSENCENEANGNFHEYSCEKSSILPEESRKALRELNELCKRTGYKYPLMMVSVVSHFLATKKNPWLHIFVPAVKIDTLQDKWASEINLICQIYNYLPEARPFLSMEAYLNFCAMFRANCIFMKTHGVSLGITQEEINQRGNWSEGHGLYLFSSLINHSCFPSVEIQRTRDHFTDFYASEDIHPGEELTIDYLDLYEEYGPMAWGVDPRILHENVQLEILERFTHRQTQMKENYNCFCLCKLCLRDHPLVQMLYKSTESE